MARSSCNLGLGTRGTKVSRCVTHRNRRKVDLSDATVSPLVMNSTEAVTAGCLPTLHVSDLASVIVAVVTHQPQQQVPSTISFAMPLTPLQYIVATDTSRATPKQLAEAISGYWGNGTVSSVDGVCRLCCVEER